MTKNITLSTIMSKDVITCTADDEVKDAAAKMKDYHVGIIVVVGNKGKVEGLISERDIINKVVSEGASLNGLKVKEVMQRNVITGSPDMTDVEAAALFAKKGIKKLPLIKNGKLVGVVTQTDILKTMAIKWAL